VTFRVTNYVDENGSVTTRRTHGTIDGVLIKQSTGEVLTTRAHWAETRDFLDDTKPEWVGCREATSRFFGYLGQQDGPTVEAVVNADGSLPTAV
jgi:hypothetical protein